MARGFLDVDATLETRGDLPKAKIVYLVFHVSEHPRVARRLARVPVPQGGRDPPPLRELRTARPRSATSSTRSSRTTSRAAALPSIRIRTGSTRSSTGTNESLRDARAVPLDLNPDAVFVAETYDRAILHVQELFRNEGSSTRSSAPSRCSAATATLALVRASAGWSRHRTRPSDVCAYDASNLPVEDTRLDAQLTCVPDRARGVECERHISLRSLSSSDRGRRSTTWASTARARLRRRSSRSRRAWRSGREAELAGARGGAAACARRVSGGGVRVRGREVTLEESLDHTRARATFEVVEGEGHRRRIVSGGNDVTVETVIRRGFALVVGQPYRASLVRKTQSQIATLNVFRR